MQNIHFLLILSEFKEFFSPLLASLLLIVLQFKYPLNMKINIFIIKYDLDNSLWDSLSENQLQTMILSQNKSK